MSILTIPIGINGMSINRIGTINLHQQTSTVLTQFSLRLDRFSNIQPGIILILFINATWWKKRQRHIVLVVHLIFMDFVAVFHFLGRSGSKNDDGSPSTGFSSLKRRSFFKILTKDGSARKFGDCWVYCILLDWPQKPWGFLLISDRPTHPKKKSFEGYDKQGSHTMTTTPWSPYSYGGGMVLWLFWLVISFSRLKVPYRSWMLDGFGFITHPPRMQSWQIKVFRLGFPGYLRKVVLVGDC